MSIIFQEDSPDKLKLSDIEQELYDAALDEYNDIFENILNINEKILFDKISLLYLITFG